MRYLIGIDEAGRGPLAGPVSVGAVMVPPDFDMNRMVGVRDSKQLSEKAREECFTMLSVLQDAGDIRFAVEFSSAYYIDAYGIVPAIRSALARVLARLGAAPEESSVLLDGSLSAPEGFLIQKTIIRGDQTVPLISAASIVAKVLRDRYMVRLAGKYPLYRFEEHKGYGTAEHRKLITQHGFCKAHRTTFCTRLSGNIITDTVSEV